MKQNLLERRTRLIAPMLGVMLAGWTLLGLNAVGADFVADLVMKSTIEEADQTIASIKKTLQADTNANAVAIMLVNINLSPANYTVPAASKPGQEKFLKRLSGAKRMVTGMKQHLMGELVDTQMRDKLNAMWPETGDKAAKEQRELAEQARAMEEILGAVIQLSKSGGGRFGTTEAGKRYIEARQKLIDLIKWGISDSGSPDEELLNRCASKSYDKIVCVIYGQIWRDFLALGSAVAN